MNPSEGWGLPNTYESLYESVYNVLKEEGFEGDIPARIFRRAMRVIDEVVRGSNPDDPSCITYERLRNGLPLCDIWLLLNKLTVFGSAVSFEYASFLLDYYVDNGTVVPVVEEIDGSYYRTYRSGEADPVEFSEFIHNLLKKHQKMYPKHPLSVTAFTKILSAIAVYHPNKVPLDPVFEFHGRVPYMISSDGVVKQLNDAVQYLVRKHVITITQPSLEPVSDQLVLLAQE